jgi:hypothetical protein
MASVYVPLPTRSKNPARGEMPGRGGALLAVDADAIGDAVHETEKEIRAHVSLLAWTVFRYVAHSGASLANVSHAWPTMASRSSDVIT